MTPEVAKLFLGYEGLAYLINGLTWLAIMAGIYLLCLCFKTGGDITVENRHVHHHHFDDEDEDEFEDEE